jgi:hypothetical protein
MFKKRFIYEQEEEEVELNDFQKILALHKKRMHPNQVEFVNSEGKDFSDIISINYDGITFKFDGLQEYLAFFFPEIYGGDGSDGSYEAGYFQQMYNGNWDWSNEYWDRSTDDWNEGYIVGAMKSQSLETLKEIIDAVSPGDSKCIVFKDGKYVLDNSSDKSNAETTITSILEGLGVEDKVKEAYVDAQVDAVSDEVFKYIEDTYGDCFSELGIENDSARHFFWKYSMDWGSMVLLFARFGTENDSFLDLLFEAINSTSISHLPEYYEIQYNVWNEEKFTKTYVGELSPIFDKLLIEVSENHNKGYYEAIAKITKIGGFNTWITSKNEKVKLMIRNLDPETLKVDFSVVNGKGNWQSKQGRSTVGEIINLLYNESMFDVEDFREHYLRFLQKTIL